MRSTRAERSCLLPDDGGPSSGEHETYPFAGQVRIVVVPELAEGLPMGTDPAVPLVRSHKPVPLPDLPQERAGEATGGALMASMTNEPKRGPQAWLKPPM